MVTYHRARDLQRCLESVFGHTHTPFRLTIIDNSQGAIDGLLSEAADRWPLQAIRNRYNLGKSLSFHKWYRQIAPQAPYFVSMDSDIYVPPVNSQGKDWLQILLETAAGIPRLGLLAPVLQNGQEDTFLAQTNRKKLTMHGGQEGFRRAKESLPDIFHSPHTAGPLLLIHRGFYEECGGYPGDALFGRDDGYLCQMALRMNRFVGFTSYLSCLHLDKDNTPKYQQWKLENLNRPVSRGYWDRAGNGDSIC